MRYPCCSAKGSKALFSYCRAVKRDTGRFDRSAIPCRENRHGDQNGKRRSLFCHRIPWNSSASQVFDIPIVSDTNVMKLTSPTPVRLQLDARKQVDIKPSRNARAPRERSVRVPQRTLKGHLNSVLVSGSKKCRSYSF